MCILDVRWFGDMRCDIKGPCVGGIMQLLLFIGTGVSLAVEPHVVISLAVESLVN